ncbi:putative SAICAR synthase-like protein [Lyophyllum shimeji]|uniref:1-phosphatidylinositol-4-phosphate 5-kinase n=1 Tax=Lyophyllum shimeji TaxID=47721 RepID=A0A9P3UKG3_LYOSH|nr:putative SAICAR synthase-like protein [Lyophyllum shimeji]
MATTAVLPPTSVIDRRTPSPAASNSHRLSSQSAISSSAASFQTAPLTASSSMQTVTSPLPRTSQEVHFVTVTEETLKLEKRPAAPDSYITRVMAGPLPPSPPASVKHDDDDVDNTILCTEPEPEHEPVQPPQPHTHPSVPLPQRLHRSSTDTKASSLRTTVTTPPSSQAHLPTPPPTSFSKSAAHLSADGYLQPPPLSVHRDRPTRRNTTGSTPKAVPMPVPTSGGALEDDIQLHAENIRRERLSKRAKMQQAAEAEAALTRQRSKDPKENGDVVLVGNLIGEGHVNYVLMYNMLTGIRIGVSRCQAKIKRPLTDDDFTARHKYSFDVVGNELTPSAKYDFKFKDYAPWVFRSLREDHFHLDPADYLLSLTSKYILSELGSPGKSGSFFYFSRDYRFIIKTIHHTEHAFLLRILPLYYAHVRANPHTLLSRFYGLHRVKLPRGRKIHFVIMNNIFPPHRDIHETYDLKGSTVGREYPEEKARENPRAVLKDLNWINRGRTLELGPEKRALLTEQLRRDSEFLKNVNVMDYSLLVGIHNMQRGNRDNVRRNTLKVFSPHIPHTPHRKKTHSHALSHSGQQGSPEAIAMRRALYRISDSKRLDDVQLPDAADPEPQPAPEAITTALEPTTSSHHRPASLSSSHHHQPAASSSSSQYPSQHQSPHHRKGRDGGMAGEKEKDLADHFIDRQHFMFYQDEGGLRATDENNEDMHTIYYVGVIDILTPYNAKKKLENLWKGMRADRHKISPVPPSEYAERFLAFMKAIMRGGEGGERFKAE